MSRKDRKEAIEIIAHILYITRDGPRNNGVVFEKKKNKIIASAILNRLFKGGFLNDKALVHASEIKDEIDQAVFKCKVKE